MGAAHAVRQGLRRTVVALREALALAMLVAAADQAAVENWAINRHVRVPRPRVLRLLSQKLLLQQGWFMFCPDPEMEDGTIVVDAVTVDGRRLDPFTGKAPDFDLENAGSLPLSQMWGDYFVRIQSPGWAGYREAMRDYLLRLPRRTGRPGDALVSGDVYWVAERCPLWGRSRPYGHERIKLFSFEAHGTAGLGRP